MKVNVIFERLSPRPARVSLLMTALGFTAVLLMCTAGFVATQSAPPTTVPPSSSVSNFTLSDYRGKEVSLSDFRNSKLVVLAFLGTECPLAKQYASRLEQIALRYRQDQVVVVGVNSNVQDNLTEVAAFVRRNGLRYMMLKDAGNVVADAVGASRTPEVLLLDSRRIIRYRGRIDDQFSVGIMRDKPGREDLKAAIEELLAGKQVSVPQTTVTGCRIGRVREAIESSEVNYSDHIASIFRDHCVNCHREGEIAPFSLASYEDVVGWGEMIAEVVRENRMPPWHADPRYGKFSNDCSLSEADKQLIYTWVRNGCPEGNRGQIVQSEILSDGWQLPREPDKIFKMAAKPHTVPASVGPEGIAYQNFWVDPGFSKDTWIKAIEVRPGNRVVVHHIVVYLHPHGKEENFRGFLTGREFYYLGAYLPGFLAGEPFPPGAAKKIPAGSWLRFEMHYVPVGTEQQDLSYLGLLLEDADKVTNEVRTLAVVKSDFEIRPRLDNQTFVKTSAPTPIDVQLLAFFPHMHLRGKAFEYVAEYPSRNREILLSVPRFDFNWQTRYVLNAPKKLPAGSRITITASYDNSEANLANPDPSATVVNGEQTWDEMMVGYIDVLFPRKETPKFPYGFL
jgi:peroxiredoxin